MNLFRIFMKKIKEKTPTKRPRVNTRTKGHSFERKIAKDLRESNIYPDAKRHLEYEKGAALLGIDIVNTGKWLIQCKKGKQDPQKLYKFYNQVRKEQDHIRTVVVKGDGQNRPPMVIMSYDDWKGLLQTHPAIQ